MNDYLGPHAPHLREPQPRPDGAMVLAAYSVVITIVVAVLLAGWLCL